MGDIFSESYVAHVVEKEVIVIFDWTNKNVLTYLKSHLFKLNLKSYLISKEKFFF